MVPAGQLVGISSFTAESALAPELAAALSETREAKDRAEAPPTRPVHALDVGSLEVYCVAMGRWREVQATLDRERVSYDTPTGTLPAPGGGDSRNLCGPDPDGGSPVLPNAGGSDAASEGARR